MKYTYEKKASIQITIKFLFTAILLVVLTSSHAKGIIGPPQLLFVGDSGVCTYGSVQAAIDDATPNSEIRVTNEINAGSGILFENLDITQSLIIKGGYSSCGLAQLDSRADENRTVIDGTDSDNVIKIDGDGLTVELSGFTLTGGIDQGIGPNRAQGGGVSIRGDDNDITFVHMTVTDNHGRLGGGIYLSGDSNELTVQESEISENTALSGGGIYCLSSAENTAHYADMVITHNSATGDTVDTGHGGGMYLSSCRLSTLNISDNFNISTNNANNSGGGIYAVNSRLSLFGYLTSNHANVDSDDTGDGGGVFAIDVPLITLGRTFLSDNSVFEGYGGGLYIDSSNIKVHPDSYNNCSQSGYINCLRFEANRASSLAGGFATFGGAIYMSNSHFFGPKSTPAALDHFPGNFVNNHADFASAIAMTNGSHLSVQNANFEGNGSADNIVDSLFWLTGMDTELQVSFSTMADNQVSNVFNVQNNALLELINSIVYEDSAMNKVVLNNLAAVFTQCNVYHEGGSIIIALGDPSVVTDDPGFVDPDNGNYHLRSDSVAIDRCTEGGLAVVHPDLDQDERPIDVPGVDNGIGVYDAGADEYNHDLIYKNGFELYFLLFEL